MSKSPYNFEKNILGLSTPGMSIDRLPEEWIHVLYEESVDSQVKCICNHVIRHVNRYLNTQTQRMINVGTGCIKKFHLGQCKSAKTLLTKLIIGSRGDYEKIFDLIQYSDENWITFLESIQNNAISEWDNLAGLNEINEIIKAMSENHIESTKLSILENIVSEIQARLDKKAELEETHRVWTEKMNRENAQREEEQRIIYKARVEQQRIIYEAKCREEQERLEMQREADKIIEEEKRIAWLEELRSRDHLRDSLTLQRLRRVEELRSYVNKPEARFTKD